MLLRTTLAKGAVAVALTTALVGSATAVGAAEAPAPQGERLYVDPGSDAARAAAAATDPDDRAALMKVASGATATWFGDWIPTAGLADRVRTLVQAAAAEGTTPVLVAYAVPGRDCHGWSAGGLGSAAAYRSWVDELVTGIGSSPALVVVEPDALAQLDCLPRDLRRERLALLRYATAQLSKNEGTRAYLDAGHSRWVPAAEMASRLRAGGVGHARGFSLNVANFHTTDQEVQYGRELASAVDKPFVIDTSRNGRGRGDEGWCNPDGRALGTPPSTVTGQPLVDAFLWVKTPGRSDGDCGRGEPAAGVFWPAYAVGLAERAAW